MKKENDAFNEQTEFLERSGREYIKKNWGYLHSKTRKYLEDNGFDAGVRNLDNKPSYDTTMLEFSLGLFKESAASKIPTKKGDEYPSFLIDNELLSQAGNLLSLENPYNSADFARIAIHAIMKRQATLAFSELVAKGIKIGSPNLPKIIAKLILSIFFWVALPISVAYGIKEALSGEGVSASAWFFLTIFSCNFLYRKEDEKNIYVIAYEKWSSLFIEDYPFFHIGTGHGLSAKFENMICQGIYVPSLLIDLCVLLQQSRTKSCSPVTDKADD